MKSKQNNYPKSITRNGNRYYMALVTKDNVFYVNYKNDLVDMYTRTRNSNLVFAANGKKASLLMTEKLGRLEYQYISKTLDRIFKKAIRSGEFELYALK